MARDPEKRRIYNRAWRNANRQKVRDSNARFQAKFRAKFPEWAIWREMKSRCFNPKNKAFSFYGGRGITICEKWKNSFQAFLADVGRRPDPKLTIERIDNNGNYEPGNVRWATMKEQSLNTRSVRLITIDGTTDSFTSWAHRFGLNHRLVERRVAKGWDFLDAICAPAGYRKLTFRSKE